MECNKRLFGWKSRFIRNLFLVLLVFPAQIALAQVNVRGRVVDAAGETLIGVNVVVKGTRQGTITDRNGEFTLPVPSLQGILLVSYVGYSEQEVALNGRTFVEVTLKQSTEQLDEKVKIIFSHWPVVPLDDGVINIHGHIHNSPPPPEGSVLGPNHINMSVEVRDYRPWRLKDILPEA